MELSRQKMRKRALDNFKYTRTCVLARELCFIVHSNRAVLNGEDVHRLCKFISTLCEEAGCKEASSLCAKAAEAVMKKEEDYLKLCDQSCMLCHEGRTPPIPQGKHTPYIT